MESYSKSISSSVSPFDCLIFDLDDTLYPLSTGIAQAVKRNIEEFLVEKCGFPESKASNLRVELFKTHGSTLAGLRALGYNVTAQDYHSFVHGRLPYDSIKPDPQLRSLLRSINQRKIIFTNSDRIHAMNVLNRLGLMDCFEQIICFETMNPSLSVETRPDQHPIVLKPSMDAMKIAIDVANVDPRRTLFLDDNVRNVAAAKAVGLRTALVGKTVKSKEAEYCVERVNQLAQVVPEIWAGGMDGADGKRISCSKSDLDAILSPTAVGA